MVAAKPGAHVLQVTGDSIFVLKLIPKCAGCPSSLGIGCLIIKSSAVEVIHRMKLKILVAKRRVTVSLVNGVNVRSMQCVIETRQPMLPSRRAVDRKFHAAQKIVLSGALVQIWREQRIPVEVPLVLDSGRLVVMAHSQAQRCPVAQPGSDVGAFERIRIIIIRSGAGRVELVAKQVVVKGAIRARKRRVATLRAIVACVGPKTKLRNRGASSLAPKLHYTCHGIRAVECALGATHEFQAISFKQWHCTEIECSTWIVYRNAVDHHFVVARVSAAHEK